MKAVLGAAIPEELFKFLVLRWYVWRKPHFDEPLDGVVYGATASLGFATLENILYVGSHGLEMAVLRALTAVPGHAFTGVVMGAFLGRARFAEAGAALRAARGWGSARPSCCTAPMTPSCSPLGLRLPGARRAVHRGPLGRRLYKALQAEQVLDSQAVLAGALLPGPIPTEQPVLVAPLGALMAGRRRGGRDPPRA